jgi:pimeloyl-ACP methyl ester carboxylesterase
MNRRQVILVHGLWYGPVSMSLLALRLERLGLDCHRFGYPTLSQSLAVNARELHQFALALEVDQLDFVGHSLGGLVILRMLDEFGGLPPGRVVLLGSPVRGSAVVSRMLTFPATRPLIGEARTALERGFSHAPTGYPTGVIAGTHPMGLGRMIQPLNGPNDGTIEVSETQLDNAADTLQLSVSHTGLVLSAEVADAVSNFLHHGRFQSSGAASAAL